MIKNFDVVVIGGGPAGYVAAIRAAQLGFKTACIDSWKNKSGSYALGGTCTNVGCIPSKILLQSSEYYEHANRVFIQHGIEIQNINLNLQKMQSRKEEIIKQNNDGIQHLFKKNKVTFFHGLGSFTKQSTTSIDGYKIKVNGLNTEFLVASSVIIATGSNARSLKNVPFDEKLILSNIGALTMPIIPKKLGIIGAGAIGLEIGSIWRRLGSEVTLLEASSDFLSTIDKQISQEAYKLFIKQGLLIHLGIVIDKIEVEKNTVLVNYVSNHGVSQKVHFDNLIVSIGREPNTTGLDIKNSGLQVDEFGFIVVDEDCKTNLKNVWAIGDVVRGPMLAHKAEEEGIVVAERIAGQYGRIDFNTVPQVIYTSPEIAWVGKTEKILKQEGCVYKVGVFPFVANGRARTLGETSGLVKMIADATTDEILGVHIIGPMASEIISEAVLAMEFRASSEDIARICHAHPSLSEIMKESALSVDKRAINF